jgi:ABC-2 type transport system ATP-binding protein
MEEAEKISDRVAVIDNGKIVAMGTPAELKKKTKSKTLEDAFLKLTGKTIREEEATAKDRMRTHGRAWGRR